LARDKKRKEKKERKKEILVVVRSTGLRFGERERGEEKRERTR
jgi:hypothetical protein